MARWWPDGGPMVAVLTGFRCITRTVTPRAGGKGGTQQSFIRGGSAQRSKPLPFYIPFLIEKGALSYTFHKKIVPLSYTYGATFTKLLTIRGACLRYFESSL